MPSEILSLIANKMCPAQELQTRSSAIPPHTPSEDAKASQATRVTEKEKDEGGCEGDMWPGIKEVG
jgi:hypothetical protein